MRNRLELFHVEVILPHDFILPGLSNSKVVLQMDSMLSVDKDCPQNTC